MPARPSSRALLVLVVEVEVKSSGGRGGDRCLLAPPFWLPRAAASHALEQVLRSCESSGSSPGRSESPFSVVSSHQKLDVGYLPYTIKVHTLPVTPLQILQRTIFFIFLFYLRVWMQFLLRYLSCFGCSAFSGSFQALDAVPSQVALVLWMQFLLRFL